MTPKFLSWEERAEESRDIDTKEKNQSYGWRKCKDVPTTETMIEQFSFKENLCKPPRTYGWECKGKGNSSTGNIQVTADELFQADALL